MHPLSKLEKDISKQLIQIFENIQKGQSYITKFEGKPWQDLSDKVTQYKYTLIHIDYTYVYSNSTDSLHNLYREYILLETIIMSSILVTGK